MAEIRMALTVALVASATVGTLILVTDQYLWTVAYTHALGLVAFVALDFALVIAFLVGTRLAVIGAMVFAAVRTALMTGDILTYSEPGVPQAIFRSYLLNDTAFMALLAIQAVILAVAFGATAVRSVYGMAGRKISR